MKKKKEIDPVKLAKKKKRRKIQRIADLLFLICWLGWIFIPQFTAKMGIRNFEDYAVPVEQMVPPDVRIVGLGEGTHGTQEFHELKLAVFQTLVEQGYRAFVIEGTYGDGAAINEYLQGADMTLDEAVSLLSYRCYRTKQMRALLEWMRTYNKTVEEADRVRFYGCDVQHFGESAKHILSYLRASGCTEVEEDAKWLEDLEMPDYYYDETGELDEQLARMNHVRELVEKYEGESGYERRRAMQDCNTILYGMTLNATSKDYTMERDRYMAECMKWIVDEEETYYGNTKIMLSAHDGHIAKGQTATYKSLGMYLDEMYGEDYFAIGTDFFTGTVNQPSLSGRTEQHYVTCDPLAAQVRNMNSNEVYLDFSGIPSDERLYRIVNRKMNMGSLGEGYNPIMHILPYTYRIRKVPAKFYDAMILIYEGNATELE